jgi:hypothetical protein
MARQAPNIRSYEATGQTTDLQRQAGTERRNKPGPSGAKQPKEDADPEKGYFTRAAAQKPVVEHEVEDEFADPDPEAETKTLPDTDELLESDDENNNA